MHHTGLKVFSLLPDALSELLPFAQPCSCVVVLPSRFPPLLFIVNRFRGKLQFHLKQNRTNWVKKHKKLLKAGKIRQVTEAIKALCRGRSSKEFRRERNYFLRNQDRMNYHAIEGMALPIGSGVMESAIRRVVNLRLKGPAIYWHVGTAEAMLTLRSYFKAGRWNMLKSQAVTPTLEAFI